MGAEICDDDELVDVEVLESLPLGASGFHLDQPDVPPWYSLGNVPSMAQRELRDCYAMKIEWILSTWQVYPGDDISTVRARTGKRFKVLRVRHEAFLIDDLWGEFQVKIPMFLLENAYFDIRGWYAKWRAKDLHLKRPTISYHSFGNPL